MTQPGTPGPVALATFILIAMTAAACGHSSPAAPDAAAARNDGSAAATAISGAKPGSGARVSAVNTFPLAGGTFTITGRRGSSVSGTYSGETVVADGLFATKLQLQVQSGTGSLGGATGVLEGKGSGAFIGEGNFSLLVSGFLSTDGKKKTKFSASIQGSSTIACESGNVFITLHGDPPDGAKSGGDLRHQVLNVGCGF